jgi:hypothetical protein
MQSEKVVNGDGFNYQNNCAFFFTLKAPKKYLSSEIYIFYFMLILNFIATFSVFLNHKLV